MIKTSGTPAPLRNISGILPFDRPPSVISFNTAYITGVFESRIPPGGIAFGYYAYSWLGVLVFSVATGVIGKKVGKFFLSFDNEYGRVLYVVYGFFWIFFFFNGEIRQTLQRDSLLIVLLACIYWRSYRVRLNSPK